MRILHVIPAVAPRYGGPSSAIAPMCRALRDLGEETLILSTDADGLDRLQVPLAHQTLWQDVPALFFRRDVSESFKYSRGLAGWIDGHAHEFDAVHIHGVLSHAPLAASRACRRAGVPYLVRPLGTISTWSLGRKPLRKRALLTIGAGQTLRGAAAIHYTSDEERADAERHLGLSRGVVIPLGVEPTLGMWCAMPQEERDRTPYVLALSRLHPKKNLEPLIQAFVQTTVARPGWRLVIAGDGDSAYLEVLRSLVRLLSAADRVVFTGWVEGEAKRELIRGASLFAIPSLDENFGVSLIEALAAGVPAVMSRHVHLGRQACEAGAGWLVDSDANGIERGLAQAFAERAQWPERAEAARRFASRFAWPVVAGELVELYSRVCREARAERQDSAAASAVPVNR